MKFRTALAGIPAGLWRLIGACSGLAVAIVGPPLSAHAAFAADLPSRKAPAPASATTGSWTGFYAGVDGGFTWDNSAATVLAAGQGLNQIGVQQWQAYPFFAPGVASLNSSGFIGGGHVGWAYQLASLNRIVLGVETDGALLAAHNGTYTFIAPGGLNPSIAQIGRAFAWAGSARGRLGLLLTPSLMVYGTGGVSLGQANVNEVAYGNALAATYAPGVQGRIYGGVVFGGGVEWAFLPNWSLRAEYLHFDLGTHTASIPGFAYGSVPAFPVPQQFLATVPLRQDAVKIGVSYHFNGLLTGDPAKDSPLPPSL